MKRTAGTHLKGGAVAMAVGSAPVGRWCCGSRGAAHASIFILYTSTARVAERTRRRRTLPHFALYVDIMSGTIQVLAPAPHLPNPIP